MTLLGYATDKSQHTEIVDRFIEEMRENRLMASKCKACGETYLPPRAECKCQSTDMEWVEVPKEGKIVAFSIIHFGPESMAKYSPYVVGVVEFENGLRLLSRITGLTQRPQVGMKVQVAPQEVEGDQFVYKLKPA